MSLTEGTSAFSACDEAASVVTVLTAGAKALRVAGTAREERMALENIMML